MHNKLNIKWCQRNVGVRCDRYKMLCSNYFTLLQIFFLLHLKITNLFEQKTPTLKTYENSVRWLVSMDESLVYSSNLNWTQFPLKKW